MYVKLIDPTSGDEEVNLVVTDLDMVYVRDRAAAVKSDVVALATCSDAHANWKMRQVSATLAPGLYRADWPDAAFAGGVARVQLVVLGTAVDTAVQEVELEPLSDAWSAAARTLTAGTNLPTAAVIASDVWVQAARTLTASTNLNIPTRDSNATAIWAKTARTLTAGTNLPTAAVIASDVWIQAARTLTA